MQGAKGEQGMVRIMIALVLMVLVAGCSTPLSTREKGALAGGAIGAGAGAAIGSTTGHTGTGALIGAGVGVLSGALIGDAMQANEQRQAATMQPPPPPPVAAPPPPPPAPVVIAGPPPPPPPVVVAPPPPPTVSLDIHIGSPPRFVVVTGTPVYYAPSVSYNYFSYDGRYYLFHNELWFSAAHYNGPWAAIAFERVPRPILAVPVEYYKRPPGHWKKHGPPPWAQAKGHEKKEHGKKKWDDD